MPQYACFTSIGASLGGIGGLVVVAEAGVGLGAAAFFGAAGGGGPAESTYQML
jgi:hypothetical protein